MVASCACVAVTNEHIHRRLAHSKLVFYGTTEVRRTASIAKRITSPDTCDTLHPSTRACLRASLIDWRRQRGRALVAVRELGAATACARGTGQGRSLDERVHGSYAPDAAAPREPAAASAAAQADVRQGTELPAGSRGHCCLGSRRVRAQVPCDRACRVGAPVRWPAFAQSRLRLNA